MLWTSLKMPCIPGRLNDLAETEKWRGQVGGGFVRVANLLVGNAPVVIQEHVRLAIRPTKYNALPSWRLAGNKSDP